MANNDIATEYTEQKYCSKSEASRKIGFQIPESMWKKVLDYRDNFNYPLTLKWYNSNPLIYCAYPTLAKLLESLERKLENNIEEAFKIQNEYKDEFLKVFLEEIVTLNGLKINHERFNKLVSSENPFDEDEEKVINYLDAHRYIEENSDLKLDFNFVTALYSRLIGNKVLTYVYRENNIDTRFSTAVISRVYDTAPATEIEKMMNSLFSFTVNSTLPALQKAIIGFIYVLLIRPFDAHNEEMASLIAKSMLAHLKFGKNIYLINFEALCNVNFDNWKKIITDIQATNDMTYAFSLFVPTLEKAVEKFSSMTAEKIINVIKEDHYKRDDVENISETSSLEDEKEEETMIELPFDNDVEFVTEEKNEPVEEETTVIEANEQLPTNDKIEEIKAEKPEIKISNEKVSRKVAIQLVEEEFDDKMAAKLERQLLKHDVMLKKAEAHFYVKHCTLGMFYTIEQYRKSARCVYETARTSMEHLVKLGYYSKKQVGKKFVYTPVERN